MRGVNEHKQPFAVGVWVSITCVFSTTLCCKDHQSEADEESPFISEINGMLASFVLSVSVKI